MDFQHICNALTQYPDVAAAFSHSNVVKYIELIALLKPTPVLAYLQPSHQESVPPPTLPVRVHEFLKDCFDLPDETAKLAWEARGTRTGQSQAKTLAWHGFWPGSDVF
ncbi:hypothetical protein C8R47DRAFT_1192501 [Mycena vitilis]|nr:hypothetical protein C8R47DRAFT_1192501 [Mycena vitilis]